jgi:hypothetical protein
VLGQSFSFGLIEEKFWLGQSIIVKIRGFPPSPAKLCRTPCWAGHLVFGSSKKILHIKENVREKHKGVDHISNDKKYTYYFRGVPIHNNADSMELTDIKGTVASNMARCII